MIGKQDPLIGTLPQKNETGSPALAGQPPTITGASGAAVPTPQVRPGSSALASASPGSGSASIGAPLSNEAPNQKAGAGADLDLVQNRGTPAEYWQKNIGELGSRKTLQLHADAVKAASGKTAPQSEMDPEEVRRMGVKMNEAFGVGNTREAQDNAVDQLVYKPMANQIKNEVQTGTIDEDTGVMRMAMTMANTQGADTEEELEAIVETARETVAGTGEKIEEAEPVAGQEGAEEPANEWERLMAAGANKEQIEYEKERSLRGKEDSVWGRMKEWWKKGKDDPNTTVDESVETYIGPDGKLATRPVQVTSFMGGMTRQELAMFVFQWGASMMVNADKGLGGAFGSASLGALDAHQGRKLASQEKEESRAQQMIENQLAQQQADAATYETMEGADGIMYERVDGRWRAIQVKDPETGKDRALRGVGDTELEVQYLVRQAEMLGISKAEVIAAKLGQKTRPEQLTWYREQLQTLVTEQKAKVKPEDQMIMQALGNETWTWVGPDGKSKTKPIHEMTPRDIGEYASYTLRQAEAAEADYQTADAALAKYRD